LLSEHLKDFFLTTNSGYIRALPHDMLKSNPVRHLESEFITEANKKIPILISASVSRDEYNSIIGYVIGYVIVSII
jgi:hypothetical protein